MPDSLLILLNRDKTDESTSSLTLRAVQMAFRLRQCVTKLNYVARRVNNDMLDDSSTSTSSAQLLSSVLQQQSQTTSSSQQGSTLMRSSSHGIEAASDDDESDEDAVRRWRLRIGASETGAQASPQMPRFGSSSSMPSSMNNSSSSATTVDSVGLLMSGNVASAATGLTNDALAIGAGDKLVTACSFGIACGVAVALFIGGINNQWMFMLGGAAVKRAQVCSAALSDGVAVSDDEWDAVRHMAPSVASRAIPSQPLDLCSLSGDISSQQARPIGIQQIDELSARLQRRLEHLYDIEAALIAHMSLPVIDRLRNGTESSWLNQMRVVSVVTLRFVGLRFDELHASEVHAVAQMLQSLANHYGGSVTSFAQDSRDAVGIVVFGLPPLTSEDLASPAANLALHVLSTLGNGNISVDASAGIATGRLVAATVGFSLRKTVKDHCLYVVRFNNPMHVDVFVWQCRHA